MPAAPTVLRLLWGWTGNGVGLAIVGLGTALYLRGVWAMRRRGDAWPVGRTISWLLGMVIIAWATFGGLGVYSHVLFSAHMASHMMLSMVAPIFLVLGAPMTLALRTLPGPRQPGEVSPRAMLLSFLHSRFSQFITHPLVGPLLFVGSLYGLYFSGAFETLMGNHWGHTIMELHFLAVGTLFYYVLIGIDPATACARPDRTFRDADRDDPVPRVLRDRGHVVQHGVRRRLLARPRPALPHGSARRPVPRRRHGLGDGGDPAGPGHGRAAVQWFRTDAREAKRFDRSENRTGDEPLEAYNARLRDLAEHGKRRDP